MSRVFVSIVVILAFSEILAPVFAQSTLRPTDQNVMIEASKAEAYYLFMLGRHLEESGDIAAVANVYEEVARLDPSSAESLSALSAMYARYNKADEAIETADRALQRDPDSEEAHRIIGMVYAAVVEGRAVDTKLPQDSHSMARYARQSIGHLEQSRTLSGFTDASVLLALGSLYIHLDDNNDAVEVLEELVSEAPYFSQAFRLLARAYVRVGRRAEAITTLELTIDRRPSSRALQQLAELCEEIHCWKKTASAYEKLVERIPDRASLKRQWAAALLNAGELVQARDVIQEVVRTRPADAAGLYLLSDIEHRLDNFDAAESAARRLIMVEPDELRGLFALARVFEHRREYRKVLETLRPAVEVAARSAATPRQTAGLFAQIGSAHQALAQFVESIASFKKANDLFPENLTLEIKLARAYITANQFLEALDVVQASQKRHPNNLVLSFLEAESLRETRQFVQAESVLQAALANHQDRPVAYVVFADLLGDTGQFEEAHHTLSVAHERFPQDTSVFFQRGIVFAQQEHYSDAEREFREVLARAPRHAQALNYLGDILADRGESLKESVDLLSKAVEIDPFNGVFLDSLGWAYFKLDRLDLAEVHLQKASDRLDDNSVVHDHLGALLYRLMRYHEAIAAWEKALAGDRKRIDPANIERKIRNARERLGLE